MLNEKDIEELKKQEVTAAITTFGDADPTQVALALRASGMPSALIATQIELRRKAAEKIPLWAEKGCLFDRTALEQCTGDVAADLKFDISGTTALDLTMGLGVDTSYLASRFGRVTAVEQNPALCKLGAHNFAQLGLENISIRNADAAQFLREQPDQSWEWIYIDPARRDGAGRRLFGFAECEPDVLQMLPELLRAGKNVWIKASPMLRIEDALQQLGVPAEVRVIAVNGECKEINFLLGAGIQDKIEARWQRDGQNFAFSGSPSMAVSGFTPPHETPFYLLEPDVSIYVADLATDYFDQFDSPFGMNHPMGYFFTETLPPGFSGRAFQVLEMAPYKPKTLKKALHGYGFNRIHITSRNFDIPIAEVRKRLNFKDGEDGFLLLTRFPNGERWAFWGQRV